MARRPPDHQKNASSMEGGSRILARGGWLGSRFSSRSGVNASSVRPATPPPPKKERKDGLIGFFSSLFTVLALSAVILAGGFIFLSNEYSRPGPLTADRTILIERGTTSEEVADLMEKEGVISRPTLFWISLLLRDIQSKLSADGNSRRVKSGEYQIRQAATMSEVIEIITSGRSIQHVITIPEGLTSEQIVLRLMENDLLVGDVASIPPEGSLLPDTYKIDRGTSRESLLARMQREQRRVLQEVWSRRSKDTPLRSPRELVVLASIVEKETGKADERPRVASVFFNRLEKKMRLESDPTIIYGLIGGKGVLGRGLTRAEIDQVTPYNTYKINGLPPGPIANPGRAAMEATANPSRTNDLFFVADGTGGHVFAETYPQHLRNVERWRQIEASRAKEQPRDVRAPLQAPLSGGQTGPQAPSFSPPPVSSAPIIVPPPVDNPAVTSPQEKDQRGAVTGSIPVNTKVTSPSAPSPMAQGFGAPERRRETASNPTPLPLREATGSAGDPQMQGNGLRTINPPAQSNVQPRPRPLP